MTSLVSYLGANALNYSPYHSYNLDDYSSYGSYTNFGTMSNYGSIWNGAFTSNSIAQNEEMYTMQMESNLRMQEKQRAYAAQANAPERLLNAKIGELQAEILQNRQDTMMTKYNEAIAQVKAMNPDMSDAEAKAYFQEYYANATGSNLTQDIKNNGSSDFTTGLKKGLFFGLGSVFTNKKSADQNVREMNHQETTTSEKATKKAGGALSGTASGAAVGAAAGSFICPGIGTAVGAAIGAVGGLISGLFVA